MEMEIDKEVKLGGTWTWIWMEARWGWVGESGRQPPPTPPGKSELRSQQGGRKQFDSLKHMLVQYDTTA